MSDVIRRDIVNERQILETHRRNEGFLNDINQRLVFFSVAVPPAERLDVIAIALTQTEDRRVDLKTRFDNVGLQIDPKLRDAQARFETSLKNLREEVGDHQRAIGGLESELSGLEIRLGAGAGSAGSRMSFRYYRSQFRERVRSLALFRHLRPIFVERRGKTSDARFAEKLAEELERLEKARQQSDATIGTVGSP